MIHMPINNNSNSGMIHLVPPPVMHSHDIPPPVDGTGVQPMRVMSQAEMSQAAGTVMFPQTTPAAPGAPQDHSAQYVYPKLAHSVAAPVSAVGTATAGIVIPQSSPAIVTSHSQALVCTLPRDASSGVVLPQALLPVKAEPVGVSTTLVVLPNDVKP